MNSRERMLTALSRGQPDRVPVFDWIDEKVILGLAALLGYETPEGNADGPPRHGEESAEVLDLYARIIEDLDLDAAWSSYSIGLEAESPDWGRDKYGRGFMLSEHGIPAIMDGPVTCLKDAEAFDMAALVDEDDFTSARRMIERFGRDKAHVGSINGPFQEGWLIRGGMDKYMLDYARDAELAHAVGRLTTDFNKRVIDIYAEIGVDIVILDGDLTGNDYTLMSPEHYREFIKPYKKEIVDHGHARGLKVAKHSDGNMWALLDEMVDAGFDAFHPIQPQCMDIAQTKAYLAGKVCLFGNVDCLDLLVFGAPEAVEAETRRTIELAAPGGGFVLCSSNSLHPGVKPENALAMFRAAKTFGDYADIPEPPPLDPDDLPMDILTKAPPRERRQNRRRARAL
jgi:uroporphyrinogen decarboxylase